jgi:hypothetical protein
MVIGFNIDDVIRNISDRVWGFHKKENPDSELEVTDINLGDLMNSLKLTKEEYEEFIADYMLEIYASTVDQYKNSNMDFNQLFHFLNENGHEVVIIQEETGKIKAATLYFLSDRCIEINSIFFINDPLDFNKKCDIFVTANPKYLSNDNLKTIKVNRHYNKDIVKNVSINEIKDLFNIDLNNLNF